MEERAGRNVRSLSIADCHLLIGSSGGLPSEICYIVHEHKTNAVFVQGIANRRHVCHCQVEPFQRSLKDMDVDVMINGRRRDHGFERAQLEVRHLWDSLLVAARGRSLLPVCCGLLSALTLPWRLSSLPGICEAAVQVEECCRCLRKGTPSKPTPWRGGSLKTAWNTWRGAAWNGILCMTRCTTLASAPAPALHRVCHVFRLQHPSSEGIHGQHVPAGGAQHTLTTAHPARMAQGYPSIGDLHSTVPVPKEKWYEYAGERSGRFQVWPQRGFLPSCCESQDALCLAEKRCWHMLSPTGAPRAVTTCVSTVSKL